mgnify:CR=1 FL=1
MHLYYLAQYLPVSDKLTEKGHTAVFVIHQNTDQIEILKQVVTAEQLNVIWVEDTQTARARYLADKPDWLVTGNLMEDLDAIHQHTKTALMQHGIGPKSCYYTVSKALTSVRFVEGPHRLERLKQLYPNGEFVDTGYAKLDPVINQTSQAFDLLKAELDPTKKTLLYAPTFYPSSIEMLPKNWPEQLSDYNLIIKPHFFTYCKKRYKKQRALLAHWQTYSNVYFAAQHEHSLLPFMQSADILISDASSTLFEFVALGKPAIWCDFYKLRWTYRGIFSYRFKQRLDPDLKYFAEVATQVKNPSELKQAIKKLVENPEIKADKRVEYTAKMVGQVDGSVSERIVAYLESH